MAYLSDLYKKLSEKAELFPLPEVHLLGNAGCVIAGHRGLYSLSDEEVIVRRKYDRVRVVGKGLKAESADESEIVLLGEILSVSLLSE